MNKKLLDAYSCVGKGWWSLLDKYIPAILAIDPECEFEPKEKFGELRLQAFPSIDCESDKKQEIWRLEQEAEEESTLICEYCGKAGRFRHENRSWYLTLCDACDSMGGEEVRDLCLYQQALLGKKYEEVIGLERTKELLRQWRTLPVKNTLQSEEYKTWYNALTHNEQGVVLGWNAEAEACGYSKRNEV